MSRYDEDLYDNPFFIELEEKHKTLFNKASSHRWLICIPRYNRVKDEVNSRTDFEDHILVPGQGNTFTTVSKHTVSINNGKIHLDSGFKVPRDVEILFEETFYNGLDESYRVLCVAEYFNRDPTKGADASQAVDLTRQPSTYDDYIRLLWGHSGSGKTKESLDRLLLTFCTEYQRFSGDIVPALVDLVQSHVTKAMQLMLKDHNVKRNLKDNDVYLASLKISVEMYLMNAVHKHLFSVITNLVRHRDANINKMTRNLTDVRLSHLDVRSEYEQNVPAARKELSMLNQYSTPIGRLLCLKRVVTALTRPIKARMDDESLMVTTDDLLPLLIFLILKSPIPNWTANLMYMKHFLLSRVTETDEFSFYLATTEGALDYISSGNIKAIKSSPQKPDPMYNRQGSTGSLTSAKEKFFQYVQYGDETAVSLMLRRPSSGQDNVLTQLCHPLCTCEKCVETLARSKQNSGVVSPIVRDDYGRTALHLAAFYGQAGLIDVLVKNGCLVDGTDYLGNTPLHMAAQKGYQNIILLLVHFGANISATDNEGNTPLHMCTKNGHEDCVKAILFLDILKNRLNVNAKNDFGDTPLHLAAKWGYDGIVSFLLETEADPRVRNRKHQTALDVAQNPDIKRSLQVILDDPPPMIIRHPVPPSPTSPTDNNGCVRPNPDSPAVANNKPARPKLSNPDRRHSSSEQSNISGQTPLGFEVIDVKTPHSSVQMIDSRAMMSPTTPVVASLDQEDLRRIEKLYKAIGDYDFPLVQYHLGWVEGDSPSSPELSPNATSQLCHPLCMCDKCTHIQKHSNMNCLPINCRNSKGFTPLHIAIMRNNAEVFDGLLQRGALVNAQTNTKITPLHHACYHDRTRMVRRLIQCGANVNLADSHGEIPLHLACDRCSAKTVSILLQHNSPANAVNIDGVTPLHRAVMRNHVDIVKLLLDHGARPDAVNKLNQSVIDMAKSTEVRVLLELRQNVVTTVPQSVSAPENLAPSRQGQGTSGEAQRQATPTGAQGQTTQAITQGQATPRGTQGQKTAQGQTIPENSQGQTIPENAQGQTIPENAHGQTTTTGQEHGKLKELVSDLDDHHLHSLQQLGLDIKSFDKDKSLKRSKTFDYSRPSVDSRDLKLSLAIKHFDKSKSLRKNSTDDHSSPILEDRDLKLSLEIKHFGKEHSLRRSKTLDKSQLFLDSLKLPLSIQHFDSDGLRHVDTVDKSSPLHIYALARSYSCYEHEFEDSPVEEEDKCVEESENGDNWDAIESEELKREVTGEKLQNHDSQSDTCDTFSSNNEIQNDSGVLNHTAVANDAVEKEISVNESWVDVKSDLVLDSCTGTNVLNPVNNEIDESFTTANGNDFNVDNPDIDTVNKTATDVVDTEIEPADAGNVLSKESVSSHVGNVGETEQSNEAILN